MCSSYNKKGGKVQHNNNIRGKSQINDIQYKVNRLDNTNINGIMLTVFVFYFCIGKLFFRTFTLTIFVKRLCNVTHIEHLLLKVKPPY